ncbi:formate dehydrogenase subunit gamma [Pararobbsia alpina]|uniref:NADP-reducing hydrogenase subunit HndA n=1 Tax=Pararobbsia alpina TaxID=621374 RepID=A0A6S7B8M2_9BURK|nr:formate dehydrogenase subunit gamma [Pararobbsia alpina]CAB3782843.1 NADP-reducing hydrogenase subunit HndA [Pararobbsia alpina]
MTVPSRGADPVDEAITAHIAIPGALLPILHDVQDALGYIPGDAISRIAQALNLSRAEVYGVVTYYHYFRAEPPASHIVQVCRAEACQAMGSDALVSHIRARLGCSGSDSDPSNKFCVEPVYCLGLCGAAPALTLDGRPYARVTPDSFDNLVSELEVGS